jgi:protein-S-isoprenylcysteine O-methyltransferase Ste14
MRAAGAALGVLHAGLLLGALAAVDRAGQVVRDPGLAIFAVCTTGFVVAEAGAQSAPDIGTGGPAARFDRMVAAATGVSLLALFVAGVAERVPGALAAWQVAGAAAMVVGVALRCAAIRALGRSFVTEARAPAGESLEVRGVYRVMRHPSETGLSAIGLGAASVLESTVALAIWAALLVPTTLLRIQREDRVLASAFPEEHLRYARAVGALLPRLELRRARGNGHRHATR